VGRCRRVQDVTFLRLVCVEGRVLKFTPVEVGCLDMTSPRLGNEMGQAPGAAFNIRIERALAAGSPADLGRGMRSLPRMCHNALVGALLALSVLAADSVAQVASQPAPPSGYSNRLWNTSSGLPINEIWDVERTPDGYLWLATFAGLVRFDGRRFQVFSASEHPELPSDRIEEIRLRPDGSLLLRTELGHLVAFDGDDFTVLVPGPVADGLVNRIWEDASGQLWLSVDGRDYGRMVEGEFISAFDSPPGWDVVRSVQLDTVTWMGTRDGRVFAVGSSGVSDRTPYASDGTRPWPEILDLALGPDGRIYVGTPEGLFRLDPTGGQPQRLSSGAVDQMATSPDGTALVGFGTDAVRVEADGVPRPVIGSTRGSALPVLWEPDGTFWHVAGTTLHRDGEPVTEVAGLVHELLVDDDGSTWLATQSGLQHVTPNIFASYQPSLVELRAACQEMVCLPMFAVYSLLEAADSSIIVGTLDFGTWALRPDGDLRLLSFLPALSLLGGEDVALMGTFGGGVCLVEDSACVRPTGTEGIGSAVVRALARGPDGDLWIGADQEVLRIRDGRATRIGAAQGLPPGQVVAVIPTAEGGAWVATFGGLARVRGGRAEVLDEADGLSSNVIRSLHLADDGVLWVGTEGRGLNRVVLTGETLKDADITHYSTQDGLFADAIHTILDDGLGRLWMSSNDGIFWVRKAELEAFAHGETTQLRSVAYLERDGLGNREANGGTQSAGLRASDGRLWFATMGGAAVVDPKSVGAVSKPLSVLIESVSSGGVVFGRSDLVVLGSDSRNLQVEYTAPMFRGAQSLSFRYRMDGYDVDWVEAGARRTAFYTNLPPGEHTFRVAAAGSEGVWYEAPASLQISVTPLFHERGWFFPLALVVSLGLVTLLGVHRQSRLQAQAKALSDLVSERTRQLEQEKEESEHARRAAEEAEARVTEALEVVAAQAARLQELDEAKSRLFANISHELRTPLTLTIGPLEDLQDELTGRVTDETMKGVDIALTNSRRLLRLVNQLLDVAKLEHGKFGIHPVILDLAELMRVVAEAFGPLARRRGVGLETEGLNQMLHATVDGDAVEKMLLNLLSNAFKATERGDSVYLRLEKVEGRAQIEVQDEGTGIPPEVLPRIFERFYQGAHSSTSDEPGTGIGLALVRDLVKMHGGEVRVESEMGVGSRFTIDLPLVAPSAIGVVTESPGTGPQAPEVREAEVLSDTASPDFSPHEEDALVGRGEDHRTTILLVDDNADIRAYVRKHLADTYRVVEAEEGQGALDLAKEDPPDLVLADVMMPGMDGEDLCRRIKGDPDLEFVPVVLLTAKASAQSRVQGLELGADDYLTKPFNKAELRARIANLIHRSKRLRDRLRGVQIVARGVPPDRVSPDERFLARVRSVILDRMDDEDFGVEELASELGQSRAHLYRRLGELHHESPAGLVKALRLQRAAELLRAGEGTVSEVAYAVGFKSVSHFSRSFREEYGATPSRFARAEAADA